MIYQPDSVCTTNNEVLTFYALPSQAEAVQKIGLRTS